MPIHKEYAPAKHPRKMNQLSDLLNCHLVMDSDNDQPIVESLCVGFDARMRLVAVIEHTDYDEPAYSCSVSAVINKDDAYELSRWLNVPMTHLPGAIGEAVKAQTEVVNPSTREVQECFKAIVNLFVDGKCPYRIIRKYGKHGFIIC